MHGGFINRFAGLFWLFVSMLGPVAWGEEARLSISGYDPVAYFTDGKPVPGSSEFEYVWHDARWRFSSPAHRELFVVNPERYAPQYDGYCAMGASLEKGAHKDTVDPNAWAIVDGKLYLTHTTRSLARWKEKPPKTSSEPTRTGQPSSIRLNPWWSVRPAVLPRLPW